MKAKKETPVDAGVFDTGVLQTMSLFVHF